VGGTLRSRCLRRQEKEEAPCMVEDLTREEAIRICIQENLQRSDLTPIEEAGAFYQLIAEKIRLNFLKENNIGPRGLTPTQNQNLEKEYDQIWSFSRKKREVKEVADNLKISASTISNRLHLLILPDEIQKAINFKKLDVTFGYEISRLGQISDKETMTECIMEVWGKAESGNYTIKHLGKIISDVLNKVLRSKGKERTEGGREEITREPEEMQKGLEGEVVEKEIEEEIKEIKEEEEAKKKSEKEEIEPSVRIPVSMSASVKPKEKKIEKEILEKKEEDEDWKDLGKVKCAYCGKELIILKLRDRWISVPPKPPKEDSQHQEKESIKQRNIE